MDKEPDMPVMLHIIQNAMDTTHLLLKYIAETHKAGKSLDYALPAIELHISGLDTLTGPAKMKDAIDMIEKSIQHIKEVH